MGQQSECGFKTFFTGYERRFELAHCTGGTPRLHHKLENFSVLFNELCLRHLLSVSATTSPGTTASNHHLCSSKLHLRRLEQPKPEPNRTTIRRPGAGAAAEEFAHNSSTCLSAARQRLGCVIFNGTTQLGAVILAARLRLGCVVLALVLPYADVPGDFSSDPTIQLGSVIPAARL